MRPRSITNIEEFSDGLEMGSIYQYYELQPLEELKEELKRSTGFDGEYRRITPASKDRKARDDERNWRLSQGDAVIYA